LISGSALVYPGDPAVRMAPVCEAPFRLTELALTTHVLTHLDAPRHFYAEGQSISDLPVERFLCEALVVEIEGDAVVPSHVPARCAGMAVLFKTRHSGPWAREYDHNHVYLTPEAATLLAERGANLAGVDYLDVDRDGDSEYTVHRTLLGAGVLILEGLDLRDVPPGAYRLAAFPLRIQDGDGAPVRAVLL
jgi:arylformamidase